MTRVPYRAELKLKLKFKLGLGLGVRRAGRQLSHLSFAGIT